VESAAGIEETLAVFHIGARQQHLPDLPTVTGKEFTVSVHQQRLTDSGSGLLLRQVQGWAKVQRRHARPNGARSDEDEADAFVHQGADLPHQIRHVGDVQSVLPACQRGSADFDDDRLRHS